MNNTENRDPSFAKTRSDTVFTWKPNDTLKPYSNKAINARFPHQTPPLCPALMFLRENAHFHATSHAHLTKLIILIITTCLIKAANSSIVPNIVEYGKCVSLELPQDFNITRFSGVWFQVEEIPNTYVDVKQCMRTIYQWDGSALQVLTEGLDEDGERAEQETTISVVTPGNYSQDKPYLQIRSDIVPPVPYHIVDIDYDVFACVYSCFDFLGLKAEIYSILSRSPEASNATLSTCRDSFEALGLSLEKMVSVQQGEQCWYSEGGANTSSTLSPFFLAEDEAEENEGFGRGLEDALLSAAEEVAGAVERVEEELFGTAEEYPKTTTIPAESKQPEEDLRRRRPKKKQREKDGSRGRSYPVSSAVSSTPSLVLPDDPRDPQSSSSSSPAGATPSESERHAGGAATSTTTPGFIVALQLVALHVWTVLR